MSPRVHFRRLGAWAALLLSAVLALAGCGVPLDRNPTAIDPSTVPFGLVEPSASPSGEPASPSPAADSPRIYLVNGDHLFVPVVRAGRLSENPEDALRTVLELLDQGPTQAERDAGLSSSLPPGAVLTLSKLEGGTATIDVSGDFAGPSAGELPLLAGQIVLSATTISPVTSVLLTRDGVQIPQPQADGSTTDLPLTAPDFAGLLAAQPPSPSPSPSTS